MQEETKAKEKNHENNKKRRRHELQGWIEGKKPNKEWTEGRGRDNKHRDTED